MNAENTPAYLLKQIEEALRRAFSSKTKLEMMLQHQFSKNLEDIARGEDLTEIVYKLVQYFQNQNKLERFIHKALEENSGSSELQNIARKFKITTHVFKILLPLQENYIKQFQQAYKICCTDNLLNDWKTEIPDSLEEILENLEDIPQQNYNEIIIVQFVARLLEARNLPEQSANMLRQWGEENANNFSKLLTEISIKNTSCQQREDRQPYLIVKLDSSQQYHQKSQHSYLVSAWFISDTRNYDYLQNHENCKFLENAQDDGEFEESVFPIDYIPQLLEFFLNQLTQDSIESYRQPIIVFFLPHQLLNHEIERFEIQDDDDLPIPIGSEYCVIFRSVKRLKQYRHREKWLRKWKTIKDSCEMICSHKFASSHLESWEELYSYLEQIDGLALKLNQTPCDDILKVIDRTGIPITLWLRKNDFNQINFQGELDKLLDCKINELPEKVKQQRLQAFPQGGKQEHIGHHLALLWEDPYLLPPQIEYTTPS